MEGEEKVVSILPPSFASCSFGVLAASMSFQVRKRTRANAEQVLEFGRAAQMLMKLLPPGGRASKSRRTVGRLAESLNYGALVVWWEFWGMWACRQGARMCMGLWRGNPARG